LLSFHLLESGPTPVGPISSLGKERLEVERNIEKLMEKKDESVDIKEELSGLERHNNFLEARARLTMSAPGSYARFKTYTGKLKDFPNSPALNEVVDGFYGSFGRTAASPCFEEISEEFK
jgi:hypothetical protein